MRYQISFPPSTRRKTSPRGALSRVRVSLDVTLADLGLELSKASLSRRDSNYRGRQAYKLQIAIVRSTAAAIRDYPTVQLLRCQPCVRLALPLA